MSGTCDHSKLKSSKEIFSRRAVLNSFFLLLGILLKFLRSRCSTWGCSTFFAALRSYLRILLSNLASEPLPNSSSVTLLSLKGFETGHVTLSCFDDARINKDFPVLNL